MRAETLAVGDGTGSGTADAGATWGTNGAIVKDIKTLVTDILAQYASTRQDIVASIWTDRDSFRSDQSSMLSALQQKAQTTVLEMVNDDAVLTSKDLTTAMGELIRQMVGAGTFTNADNDVDASTVTVSAAAQTQPANTGNATCVATVRTNKGYTSEYAYAEVLELTVTNDSGLGGTAGSEPWTIVGEVAEGDKLNWNWPDGSGGSTSGTMVSAAGNNSLGNCLYNSDFDDFTVANVPDYWGVVVGAAGTNVFSEASVIYRTGGKALKITGDGGGTLTSIMQKFNVTSPTTGTSGTSYAVKPNTRYLVNCYAKDSGAGLLAGVIKIELLDQAGSPAVVADDQGTNNSISIAFSATTASYAAFSGTFVTPKVLPTTGLQLAVRVTTALTTAESMYIDDLAMYEVPDSVYAAGPSVTLFRGSTDVAKGDKWNVTVSNNYAGELQQAFWALFDLPSMGLQLPSDTGAAETITDALAVGF